MFDVSGPPCGACCWFVVLVGHLPLASGGEPSGHVVIVGCCDDVDGSWPNVDAGGGDDGGGCSLDGGTGGGSGAVNPSGFGSEHTNLFEGGASA